MKFWIWWSVLGMMLTGLGFFLGMLFSHGDGAIVWVVNGLLPGLWLSTLIKPIWPSAIFPSGGYLSILVVVIQVLLWCVLGMIVLRIMRQSRASDTE